MDCVIFVSTAYIGNDVCQDSLDMMTTPETYRQQLLQGLQELDAIAPPNSKVVLMGLVDGRILWDSLYNRRHPLGSTYEQVLPESSSPHFLVVPTLESMGSVTYECVNICVFCIFCSSGTF